MNAPDFWVVVPFFNEAGWITATLEALAAQTDRAFSLLLVDNGSTDASGAEIEAFRARHPEMTIEVIVELEKGTGAASDTGFRYAIAHGARYIARTDADCLPRRDWVANIKRAFVEELEFVIGTIKPRSDDFPLSWGDRIAIPVLIFVASNWGKIYRRGRPGQFRYAYIMVAGNNLAITASMYERADGFPRSRIEDVHEDRVLGDRIRMLTRRTRRKRNVVVYNSTRRARRYGFINTLLWYWEHRYRPQEIDVR
jgi:glycosyltransferase involved in cell wall biosynthesis